MLPSSLNRQSPSLAMHMWTDLLSSCVNVLEPAARKVAWCLSWSLHLYTMYFYSTIIFLNLLLLFNTNASFSLPSDLSLLLLAIDDPAVRAIHVLACSWSSFWGDWEVLMSTCLWYVFSIFLNQHTSMPTSVPSNFHSGRNSGLFCKAMTSCTFTRVKRHTSR